VKRIYIPLPEPETRAIMLSNLLENHRHQLSQKDLSTLIRLTEGTGITRNAKIIIITCNTGVGYILRMGKKTISANTHSNNQTFD